MGDSKANNTRGGGVIRGGALKQITQEVGV